MRRASPPINNFIKIALLLALAGGAAFLADRAIKFAADIGLFDESVTQKFQTQANGKFGVLVGGRPETLVAIQAIRDSPIIGHGSFAIDPKYLELKQELQYEYGYSDTDTAGRFRRGRNPHSLPLNHGVGRVGHIWRHLLDLRVGANLSRHHQGQPHPAAVGADLLLSLVELRLERLLLTVWERQPDVGSVFYFAELQPFRATHPANLYG